jgi:hypothetical protein
VDRSSSRSALRQVIHVEEHVRTEQLWFCTEQLWFCDHWLRHRVASSFTGSACSARNASFTANVAVTFLAKRRPLAASASSITASGSAISAATFAKVRLHE